MEENKQENIQDDIPRDAGSSQYMSVDKQLSGQSNVQQVSQNTELNEWSNQSVKEKASGFSIAGLVCGIISLICCCFGFTFVIGIAGIVFSIIGIMQSPRGKKIMGIIALTISIMGTLFGIIMLTTMFFMLKDFDFDYYYQLPEYLRADYLRSYLEQILSVIHIPLK